MFAAGSKVEPVRTGEAGKRPAPSPGQPGRTRADRGGSDDEQLRSPAVAPFEASAVVDLEVRVAGDGSG